MLRPEAFIHQLWETEKNRKECQNQTDCVVQFVLNSFLDFLFNLANFGAELCSSR